MSSGPISADKEIDELGADFDLHLDPACLQPGAIGAVAESMGRGRRAGGNAPGLLVAASVGEMGEHHCGTSGSCSRSIAWRNSSPNTPQAARKPIPAVAHGSSIVRPIAELNPRQRSAVAKSSMPA
jgi:hypothetical protein